MEEQPHAQPIEQQQNGGRGRPRLLKVEQTEPFVKRPRGRPRIERPPKIPHKRSRKPLIKTEEPPEKKRPKCRPRIHLVGHISRPKVPEYFQK